MEIFLFWIGFSILVAVAANARGRSGIGWFLLSLVISPLLALLFVLVMARQNEPQQRPVSYTTSSGPFQAESVLAGIPYRTLADGSIEAVMQGSTIRFADYPRFADAIGAAPRSPPPMPESLSPRWERRNEPPASA